MSLVRVDIRKRLKELLLDATDAGEHVFLRRSEALQEEELPAICIWIAQETRTADNASRTAYARKVTLHIEIVGVEQGDDPPEQMADVIAGQVDRLLYLNPTLGDLLQWALEPQRDELDESNSGARVVGGVRQVWECGYLEEAPEVPPELLGNFEKGQWKWILVPADHLAPGDPPDAEDEVEPEQA